MTARKTPAVTRSTLRLHPMVLTHSAEAKLRQKRRKAKKKKMDAPSEAESLIHYFGLNDGMTIA